MVSPSRRVSSRSTRRRGAEGSPKTRSSVPCERLTRTACNVGAWSQFAAEIRDVVRPAFPNAQITYKIDQKRQGIVDSWLADVDDSAARTDWGFSPEYDFDRAFREYLIPSIGNDYRS